MHRLMKQTACTVAAAAMLLMTGTMLAQATPPEGNSNGTKPATEEQITSGKLASRPPVTYDNKYELYSGLSFETFQAGQALPKRMNMGGVEVMGTYWATHKLGVAADFRGQAGTTPVFANPYTSSPLVIRFSGLGGVQYRGPKTQRFAIDLHALGGISYGNFTHTPVPAGYQTGLYKNGTSPMFALGGSVDFNRSKNVAIRLSPDIVFSHFGDEEREFFSISAGLVYRFGKQ
jgi:hypothetical protein